MSAFDDSSNSHLLSLPLQMASWSLWFYRSIPNQWEGDRRLKVISVQECRGIERRKYLIYSLYLNYFNLILVCKFLTQK